jgi:site-specific DNA-methyltransferase (adenine-specific)
MVRKGRDAVKPYYEHDGITIFHGDCREIMERIPTVCVVVTDPPYGIFDNGGKWGHKHELKWDRLPADNLDQVLQAGKQHAIWGGNYFTLPPSRGWLVWFKPDRVPSAADVELAWTSLNMNSRMLSHSIAATNAERCGHPTQKPLRVMRWTLGFFPDAECVIDPYMGSGTTLRAAKDLGKRAIGIEIEEKYCEIAVKRLAQGVMEFA